MSQLGVPAFFQELLTFISSSGEELSSVRFVFSSGEELPSQLAKGIEKGFYNAKIVNLYGSTEISADASFYEVQPTDSGAVPIGRPISNTQILILDEHFRFVPFGVAGQIYVAGDNLTRGYFNAPKLTAEKYLPNIHSLTPGQRMYATGDIGRLRRDGCIEYLGRADHTLKLNGIRINPLEIERCIVKSDGIKKCVVVPKNTESGNQVLLACVTLLPGYKLDAEGLKKQLSQSLPNYMIPTQIVVLDNLSTTTSGKIDRKALSLMSALDACLNNEYEEPIGPTEKKVSEMWGALLGLDKIGRKNKFFHLGGNSLLAIQFASRVRQIYKVELAIEVLFDSSKLKSISSIIDSHIEENRVNESKVDKQVEEMSEEELDALLAQMENS